MIFERRGGQGETSPYKQIFQIPAPGGDLGKSEPVREHRQCLLFFYRYR